MQTDDRQRLSAIAHASTPMWGPIDDRTLHELVDAARDLGLGPASRIIDLGCGPAELLRRIVEATGASGIGVDASRHAIAEARRRLGRAPARDRVELIVDDVHALEASPAFDLVMCIGPGWKGAGWDALARWAARFVVPGGHLVVADGAWRVPPSDDLLRRLDLRTDDRSSTADVIPAVRAAGLEPVRIWRASADAWSAYGTAYRQALQAFATDHPDDPLGPAAEERAGRGWEPYELLHEALDFVIVLARQPTSAASWPA